MAHSDEVCDLRGILKTGSRLADVICCDNLFGYPFDGFDSACGQNSPFLIDLMMMMTWGVAVNTVAALPRRLITYLLIYLVKGRTQMRSVICVESWRPAVIISTHHFVGDNYSWHKRVVGGRHYPFTGNQLQNSRCYVDGNQPGGNKECGIGLWL